MADSPIFDAHWYAEQAQKQMSKAAAAKHYLTRGRTSGWTPHPLFDGEEFSRGREDIVGDRDPFVVYLSSDEFIEATTHPLFDTRGYLAAYPQARTHPGGPLTHYVDVGAPAGALPNDWYMPDPAAEPGGLVDWIRQRHAEWRMRQKAVKPRFSRQWPEADGQRLLAHHGDAVPARVAEDEPLVSVIISATHVGDRLPALVEEVLSQTLADWELIVAGGADDEAAVEPANHEPRVRVLTTDAVTASAAWNTGLAAARGTYVAWLDGTARWRPDHLRLVLCALLEENAAAGYAIVERRSRDAKRSEYAAVPATPERLSVAPHVDINALVVKRGVAVQAGGFDEALPHSAGYDFVWKLAGGTRLSLVPYVGLELLGKEERGSLPGAHHAVTWDNVVLNNNLVDWASVGSQPRNAGTVSVIIPTLNDWRLTTAAVDSVATAAAQSSFDVEVVVVDNGGNATVAATLQALPVRYPGVRVVASPVNRGFALGNNIALEHVTGSKVVFLNNDTEVTPGWLEPLVEALDDDDILGAQSLLVYPSGTIQSAGIAFPSCGGVPHILLQGFPVEDAQGLESASFSALTAAALAMRTDDVIAMQGFDALYLNGMEDVDLGLRLRKVRPGRFTLRPDSVVIHHESRSAGRYKRALRNRRLLLGRWSSDLPGDDVELWRRAGFEVTGYEVFSRNTERGRLIPPRPVLARASVSSILEPPKRLRWALKNPAPAGPGAEKWGDTHFARRLAVALRSLNQEVVIDNRPEFHRATGRFDDVVLVLRGLAPYVPVYGQVSFVWIISHPDWLRRTELAAYDRVFAASTSWSEKKSREWGLRIDPLLQATDPDLFHPDRARPDTGYPVLFVGGSRQQLRPIVRDAVETGLPLSVFGSQWRGLIPKRFIKANYFPNEEVGAAYRAAGVVLNDHWEDMRLEGFLSNRLFDAVAAGARVITDDVAGLGDTFGRSVQVVRNADELHRIAAANDLDAIFGDDEERRRVASRIHQDHSFEARARQLVDAAMETYSSLSEARRKTAR